MVIESETQEVFVFEGVPYLTKEEAEKGALTKIIGDLINQLGHDEDVFVLDLNEHEKFLSNVLKTKLARSVLIRAAERLVGAFSGEKDPTSLPEDYCPCIMYGESMFLGDRDWAIVQTKKEAIELLTQKNWRGFFTSRDTSPFLFTGER